MVKRKKLEFVLPHYMYGTASSDTNAGHDTIWFGGATPVVSAEQEECLE